MIKIHLSKILGEKRMTQAELSRRSKIRASTIGAYYNELTERINLEHFDKFCEILNCDITELLEYMPNKRHK